MNNLTEIIAFLQDVLGKSAAQVFDNNMTDFTYFIRSEALNNLSISESKMKTRLRKLAEGIIAASVKCYLNENYADDYGDVELNVNPNGVYDRNMKPIDAIEKIRKTQHEMTTLMVARGMDEFMKGRHLAKIINARKNNKTIKKSVPCASKLSLIPLIEQHEVEIMRLERKLPNLTKEEAKYLTKLYDLVRMRP